MAPGKQSRARLAALVRRAQQGEADAFDEIYRLTGQAQFYLLAHKVGADAARDLVQELYLIAWRNIQNIRPYALLGYLGATGRNLVRNYLQKKSRNEGTLSLDHEDAVQGWLDTGATSDLHAVQDSPEETVVSADERARLARALRDSLDDTERAAVVMRYYQRMKIDEIAEALGTSRNTVKRTIARALVTLRQNLTVLPFGWGLAELLEGAVGTAALPSWQVPAGAAGAGLGAAGGAGTAGGGAAMARGRSQGLKAATATTAVLAMGLTAGALAFAATAPRAPEAPASDTLPATEPVPLAETPAETAPAADGEAPQLLSTTVDGEETVLAFHDASGVADAWCVGADGTTYRAVAHEDDPDDRTRSQWRFALPSGTYDVFAVDTVGNQAAGAVTCDIVPTDPVPPENNPLGTR